MLFNNLEKTAKNRPLFIKTIGDFMQKEKKSDKPDSLSVEEKEATYPKEIVVGQDKRICYSVFGELAMRFPHRPSRVRKASQNL